MGNRVHMGVKVVAEKKVNTLPDNIVYHMEDEDGCVLDTLVFSKDALHMNKGDAHKVTFTLVQDQGMNLQFAPDPDVAMWVNRGTADRIPSCPTSQPAKNNAVFHATESLGNTLVVINKNPQKCYYKFSLNFVDPTGSDPNYLYRYDPVGDNQNGGIGGFNETWLWLGGVAVAAALSYFAYLAFAK